MSYWSEVASPWSSRNTPPRHILAQEYDKAKKTDKKEKEYKMNKENCGEASIHQAAACMMTEIKKYCGIAPEPGKFPTDMRTQDGYSRNDAMIHALRCMVYAGLLKSFNLDDHSFVVNPIMQNQPAGTRLVPLFVPADEPEQERMKERI